MLPADADSIKITKDKAIWKFRDPLVAPGTTLVSFYTRSLQQ